MFLSQLKQRYDFSAPAEIEGIEVEIWFDEDIGERNAEFCIVLPAPGLACFHDITALAAPNGEIERGLADSLMAHVDACRDDGVIEGDEPARRLEKLLAA